VKDILLLVLVGVILWVTVVALRAVYVVRVIDRGEPR
jgi:hypothetical protein